MTALFHTRLDDAMTTINPKPRDDDVPAMLKSFKERFDDPSLDVYEDGVFRTVMLSSHPAVRAWRGEFLHQLALRAERRGDIPRALELYELSANSFRATEALGPARELRDCAMLYCRHIDPAAGLRMAHDALERQQDDRQNEKGERQLRVTEGYVLRAQVIAQDNVPRALPVLQELAIEGSLDFCLRDQQILVNFTVQHARGAARRALRQRQVDIYARRGRTLDMISSIARSVIDEELALAGRAVRILTGKERLTPRG